MAAQKGDSLLIKVGDGATPTEGFTTIAGLRTKTLTINAEQVDITNADTTSKMRQLLAGAGIVSLSVSGDGVFTDAATDTTLKTEMLAQTIKNYQVVVPGFGTFEGAFQLTQLEYAGEYNGEATWSLALESAGDVTFAAA